MRRGDVSGVQVEPTVEIIGDLVHVHPLVLQTTLEAKKRENIAFISDAVMDSQQLDQKIKPALLSLSGGRFSEVSRLLAGTRIASWRYPRTESACAWPELPSWLEAACRSWKSSDT